MTPAPDGSAWDTGASRDRAVVQSGSNQCSASANLFDRTHVRILSAAPDEYPGWDSNPHVLEGTMAFEAIASDQIPPPGRESQMVGVPAAEGRVYAGWTWPGSRSPRR